MKKLLTIASICFALFQALNAQPHPRVRTDVIYLICSASKNSIQEGIERYENPEDDNDPIFVHRPINFEVKSTIKNIYILFSFYSFNLTELSKIRPADPEKDQMQIAIGPRSMLRFINTLNPIKLEDKMASFKTKEEAWAWVDSIKATGKDIYLLDWNDPINGTGGGELKLIQVIPATTNRLLY